MRLPKIQIPQVGEFQKGYIPQPNEIAKSQALANAGRAVGNLLSEVANRRSESELSMATGEAAKELSALRAKLEATRTIASDEIPDDIVHEIGTTIIDEKGDLRDIGTPFSFTHDIADEWWDKKSQEIVELHASKISNPGARTKFVGEMTERYIAPGTSAIARASIAKSQAHNQAVATVSIQDVLSANAPTEERESQAKEIIARQMLMGADPLWAAQQVASIGPMVDQIDTQNAILKAQTKDQVDLVEEEMWSTGNRMSPDQMRTLSAQMDSKRADFEFVRQQQHEQGGVELTSQFFERSLTIDGVNSALEADQINRPTAMVLYNALTEGGAANASNPFSLSKWRGEIVKLPYTGSRNRVSAKSEFLKRQVQMAAMGLNPNGTPSQIGPTLSGTDALKLIEEIEERTKDALETPAYENAWNMVKAASGVTDEFGVLYGNQPNRNAAIAFKQALDTYMDQYGADADPVGFFNQNRDSFAPDKYEDDANREFVDFFPPVKQFMETKDNRNFQFPPERQQAFLQWLRLAVASGTLPRDQAEIAAAQFLAFYRGQGIAPNDGELSLEPDHPLYGQFE
jgi:hypothetical protein